MKSMALIIGLVGCLQWQENNTHHYHLYIDPQFTVDQSNSIIAAATEWQEATQNFLTFDGAGVEHGYDTISIHSVQNVQNDCDTGAIGCEESAGVDSDIYLPANVTDSDFFKQIAGHEIGHSLGMPHIGSGNLMCADRGCAAMTVQCGDVTMLAQVWGNQFDPTTLPICKP